MERGVQEERKEEIVDEEEQRLKNKSTNASGHYEPTYDRQRTIRKTHVKQEDGRVRRLIDDRY